MQPQVNILTAFLAGLVSFISPCVLPLVPSYLSFLTGTSLSDLRGEASAQAKARVLAHALAFVAGFTVIFMLIGLSVSAIGGLFASNKDLIARIGGVVIIILGLNMMGVFRIPALAMDKRFHLQNKSHSYWLSFIVGIGFAAGWSPCIGPILSGILVIASQEEIPQATFLLFVYAMGLAIPFLVTAAAVTQSLDLLNRIKRFLPAIERTSGAVLALTGVLLVTGEMTRFVGFFNEYLRPPVNL